MRGEAAREEALVRGGACSCLSCASTSIHTSLFTPLYSHLQLLELRERVLELLRLADGGARLLLRQHVAVVEARLPEVKRDGGWEEEGDGGASGGASGGEAAGGSGRR